MPHVSATLAQRVLARGIRQMGLVECRDCGHGVSTRAPACPSCGGPMDGYASTRTHFLGEPLRLWQRLWVALALLGLILAIWGSLLGDSGGDVKLWGMVLLAGGTVLASVAGILIARCREQASEPNEPAE